MEQFAEEVGIKPRLVLSRIVELAGKIEAARMRLFNEEFAPYRCDALYRLMQLIGEQIDMAVRRVS